MAGATCYQTRETIKKTPEEFITMLRSRGHFSVLEHSYFCFGIKVRDERQRLVAGFNLYKANNLFSVTEREDGLIVSGNARMFNEAFNRNDHFPVRNIFARLWYNNRVLFPGRVDFVGGLSNSIEPWFDGLIEENPVFETREEKLAHTAMCVEFDQYCRGFTHEHVRHRLASFSQESTRYVDYANGDVNLEEFQMQFVLPYNEKFDFSKKIEFFCDGKAYNMSPIEFTDIIEAFYRALRKAGLKPEEARQWLPIGLKSQIVTTANLKEWHHWFYMRTSEFAHPEIRWTALNLLRFCKERWPDLFNDFEFSKAKKDSSNCAIFTGVMAP